MIRYNPNINIGLTDKQVEERYKDNLVNFDTEVPTKSVKQIITNNIFTIFNFLNLVLAIAIVIAHSYRNLMFMGVVICNIFISTIQELRAKRIIDKLSVVSSSKVSVLRNGKIKELSINEIVLDDLIKLKLGNQVITDSVILDGECEVDESFITGEVNTIFKKKGDMLLSGSFIMSGSVTARVEHIGLDNYTAKISKEAKYIKKINSEIMSSLNKILKTITIIIFPLGIILFLRQFSVSNHNLEVSLVNTVAALIGMIPEGLVLLTSTVFAVAVLRLSKYKVLVQDLYSIETLARVDTLCLDKTGTITEGIMEVKDVIVLNKNYNIEEIMGNLCYSFKETNQTLQALKEKYEMKKNYKVNEVIPFSSVKKFSGVNFEDCGTFVIGALDFIKKDTSKYEKYLNEYSSLYRVLALGYSKKNFVSKELPDDIDVIALFLIQDKIRKEAIDIISYFNKQNVDIKLISGDNLKTVCGIAKRSGVNNYDKCIDLSKTKINYDEVDKYTVFARVNPNQKKEIIIALKKKGHIVAMTGDGVNDVLALKEADCSIGFKDGTEASRNVSNLVLLNSDFSSVLEVVLEGRRSINNLERSATLFLVKTIFSTLLTILFIFISLPYPFIPIQLTLTSTVTIGIPSLILALEPNHNIVRGKFLTNVISRSLPAALTIVINIILIMILSQIFKIDLASSSTMCVISNATIGFLLLYHISKPIDFNKKVLLVSMLILFLFQAIFFNEWFSLVLLKPIPIICLVLVLLLSVRFFKMFVNLYNYILNKYPKWFN